MTIKEISNQLHGLSLAGYFNGEKFSKSQLCNYISNMLRTSDRIIMEIALPDGRWFFSISKFRNGEYGYSIPEDRQQESHLKAILARKRR